MLAEPLENGRLLISPTKEGDEESEKLGNIFYITAKFSSKNCGG